MWKRDNKHSEDWNDLQQLAFSIILKLPADVAHSFAIVRAFVWHLSFISKTDTREWVFHFIDFCVHFSFCSKNDPDLFNVRTHAYIHTTDVNATSATQYFKSLFDFVFDWVAIWVSAGGSDGRGSGVFLFVVVVVRLILKPLFSTLTARDLKYSARCLVLNPRSRVLFDRCKAPMRAKK